MGTRYIDPAFGFMLGINSCLSQAFGIPTELAAIASLFTYWDPNTSHAAGYIVAFMVLTLAVNIIGVKWYGEIEFVFACIKISALVGLMIFGLIVDLGGIPGNKKFIGGKYWREEPFNDNWRGVRPVGLSRFLGFWGVFTKAAFAYSTTECVAVLVSRPPLVMLTNRQAKRTTPVAPCQRQSRLYFTALSSFTSFQFSLSASQSLSTLLTSSEQ